MKKTFFAPPCFDVVYKQMHSNKTHEFDYLSPLQSPNVLVLDEWGNRFQFQIKGIPVVPKSTLKLEKHKFNLLHQTLK